jgi:TetR/AcrR family transcriptional regulator, mexJK operon transcriptional repressor
MKSPPDQPGLSRREARRNDRRETILAVADRYFLEHGYAATSMSGIAATLGGSKATLWGYFPSKQLLFEAVVDHATAMFRREMSAALEPGGDVEASLRSFARHFLEKVTMPSSIALQRLVQAEAIRFPEIGEIFYERGPRTTHRMLGDFIAGAMERGLLRKGDPVQAARMLIAMCLAGCQLLLLGATAMPSPAALAADADAAVDLFLRAYAPDE